MATRNERSRSTKKLAATAMVTFCVLIVVLSVVQFFGGFNSTEPVTLVAKRAGLVMSQDAKVRLRGIVVGRVESVQSRGNDEVELKLNMDPSMFKYIPSNVGADIRSNTIFGAKSVDLAVPEKPSPKNLGAGATITADRVVVELNTLYQRLVDVLAQVQPEKLSSTLGALDQALSGRGDQIGRGLDQLSQLLKTTNPHLPQLNHDIKAGASVVNTYADVMPDLMRIADNAVYTGNTLRSNSENFSALLVNATGMANTIQGIVGPKKATIISMLSNATKTTSVLGEFAPGVRCFLDGIAVGQKKAYPIVGENGFIAINAALIPGQPKYRYPQDLPTVNASGPPSCAGLDPNTQKHAPFYVYDTGVMPYQPRTKSQINPQNFLQMLFGTGNV